MLDGALHSIASGRLDEAQPILGTALERQRRRSASCATSRSRSSRSCSATRGSRRRCARSPTSSASSHELAVDLDLAGADALGETAQVALYTIIRELLDQSIRRGPPTRIASRSRAPTRAA